MNAVRTPPLPELRTTQHLVLAAILFLVGWAWIWLLVAMQPSAESGLIAVAVVPSTLFNGFLVHRLRAWADSEVKRCYPTEPIRIPLSSRQHSQIAWICAVFVLVPLWMWS